MEEEGKRELSGFYSRDLITPEALPPGTIPLGLRVSTQEFGDASNAQYPCSASDYGLSWQNQPPRGPAPALSSPVLCLQPPFLPVGVIDRAQCV